MTASIAAAARLEVVGDDGEGEALARDRRHVAGQRAHVRHAAGLGVDAALGARAAQPALERAVDAEDRQRRLERGGVARILRHVAQHRDQGIGGDVVVARQAGPVGEDHVLDRHAPGRQRPLVGAAARRPADRRRARRTPGRCAPAASRRSGSGSPSSAGSRSRAAAAIRGGAAGGAAPAASSAIVVDVRDVAAHRDAEAAQRVAERAGAGRASGCRSRRCARSRGRCAARCR